MKIVNKIIRNNLIKRCRAGDKNAFNSLIAPYSRALFGYLIKVVQNEEIAKDLMQETLIKIWIGLKNYNEEKKFRQWIFTIAHNVFVDYLKKVNGAEPVGKDINFLSDENTPLNILIKKETLQNLSEVIDKLPLKQKEILMLRITANLKFKEIAEITGQPLNTVLGLMHQAKNNIKKLLKEKNERTSKVKKGF